MGHVRESTRREHGGALSLCIAALAASLPCAANAQHEHAAHAHSEARVPTAMLTRQLVTDAGAFTLDLTTSPQPIRLNETFELTVVVHPVSPEARGPVSVTVEANMPAHRHGMNTRPQREQLDAETFLFRGLLLHMAGEWDVALEVAQGRVRDRATGRLAIE
jgi:hypothetical protein